MKNKKNIIGGSNTSRTQLYKTGAINLSRPAKQRLKWIEHFNKYRNARLTCRHFGISPDTFYLWKKRFNSDNLEALEENFKMRRPRKTRVSKHNLQLETVKKLKNVDPRLGKIRISKILKEIGYKISSATVGRLLKSQKGLTLESKEP